MEELAGIGYALDRLHLKYFIGIVCAGRLVYKVRVFLGACSANARRAVELAQGRCGARQGARIHCLLPSYLLLPLQIWAIISPRLLVSNACCGMGCALLGGMHVARCVPRPRFPNALGGDFDRHEIHYLESA